MVVSCSVSVEGVPPGAPMGGVHDTVIALVPDPLLIPATGRLDEIENHDPVASGLVCETLSGADPRFENWIVCPDDSATFENVSGVPDGPGAGDDQYSGLDVHDITNDTPT